MQRKSQLCIWRDKVKFISYYAAKYFFDYNYEIEFDGNSSVDIPKEDILEMIPYTIDRYYFNE